MLKDMNVDLKIEGLEEFKKALTNLENAINGMKEVHITFKVLSATTSSFTREEIEEIVKETIITATIDSGEIANVINRQIRKSV